MSHAARSGRALMRRFGRGARTLSLAGLVALGCDAGGSSGAPPSAGPPAQGGQDAGAACAVVDPALATADASDLFAGTTVPTFDIWMPPERWADLQVHARDEQYVEATACFEGRGLGRVAVRFKGAYGSLYTCFDDAGVNQCKKLPLKLKFDEFEPGKRFHGLKRLNFHSNRYDETYLRERLAYDLFRSMGIVGPRAAWALVRVNGEVYGLFGMVEQVDGRMTADRWPERGDENLFKEAWPNYTDPAAAASRLETNEEEGDVSAFMAFSRAMNEAADAELRETLGNYVDLDYWARYLAVDDAIASYDGITTFYTAEDDSWSGNHNFYLYQETPNRFALIPWDVESTFYRSGFGYVPHWTRTPEDCSIKYPVWGGGSLALAPGCDRVFRALAMDLDGYRRAGRELLDGPFSEAAMKSAIDTHAAVIRDSVAKDPNGPGSARWESALAFLEGEIPGLRQRFEQLLSGESADPAEIETTGVTDFEAVNDDSLLMGTWLGCNANSTVQVSINTESPMMGERDLLMSFEYADEAEPWQQWSSFRVPVAGGVFDARALSGIRLWVRADQPRILRFDLDSPASSAAEQGIRFGWDVPVTSEATRVELRFETAAVPGWVVDEGRDPGDDLEDILQTLSGLVFFPLCAGRDASGQLGPGVTDAGFLQVDDIEFY